MSRVPMSKREEIVELSKKGYLQRNIAALTGCQLKTVNRTVQAYRDEGRIKDAPLKRRPRATLIDQDLQIVAAVNEKPFQSAKDVRSTLGLEHISDSTVRRRPREAAVRIRIAAQKPLLTVANKTARLKFAVDHRSWRVEDWKCVIFSDESTFSTRWDQQKRVWRMENTRVCPQNIKEVDASGHTLSFHGSPRTWRPPMNCGKLYHTSGNIQDYTAFIQALYGSFPERMEAVIQAGGAI
ncbi:uncharacterized protein LOC144097693 [Amblyomma americanum]